MTYQSLILKEFDAILQKNSIISISGESGTGKTSLALYLVAYMLTKEKNPENSCFWIQASEVFPKNRIVSMYKDQKEKSNYLLQNIFVTPNKVIDSYSDQIKVLGELVDEKYPFPPDLKFIVIDNISHQLRFEISKIDDIRNRISILNDFYDNLLCPLILRCQRENITLILIHEVSFNIKFQKTLPFFYTLYKRIKGVNIFLNKSPFSNERVMKIEIGKKVASLYFQLDDRGFLFKLRSILP